MFGEDPNLGFPQKQSSLVTQDVSGVKHGQGLSRTNMDVSDITGSKGAPTHFIAGKASNADGGQGAPWAQGGIYDMDMGGPRKAKCHPGMQAAGGRVQQESRGNQSCQMAGIFGGAEEMPS